LINSDLFLFLKLAEAKELFKATNKSTFNLDHCWAILKDKPKWQSTQQEYKLQSKKPPKEKKSDLSTLPPTDNTQPLSPQAEAIECNNEAGEQLFLGNKARPEGNKTAKRKRNKDELLEKVLKTPEELIKISMDRAKSVKSVMQVASNERTMAMDLTGMDEETQQYWQKKKRAILDCSQDD
jgi:hypothetical protein